MFTFNPNSSLVDTKTEISVTRLSPLQKITLEAKLIGDQGELFESHAHYIADKDGKVDVFCTVTRPWEGLTAELNPWDCYGA